MKARLLAILADENHRRELRAAGSRTCGDCTSGSTPTSRSTAPTAMRPVRGNWPAKRSNRRHCSDRLPTVQPKSLCQRGRAVKQSPKRSHSDACGFHSEVQPSMRLSPRSRSAGSLHDRESRQELTHVLRLNPPQSEVSPKPAEPLRCRQRVGHGACVVGLPCWPPCRCGPTCQAQEAVPACRDGQTPAGRGTGG